MAQLKDLIVNGDAVFGGNVTLDHDPTSALQAATKQYVDNNSGNVAVFSTHDYQASITTPTTTGYDISGTITSGTYNAIMSAISDSKVPILVDDEGDFDEANGVIRTYYYNSHDANGEPAYIQLVSLPDNDANPDEIWSLCIINGDTFGIKKLSLGGAEIWGKSANNGVYFPLNLDSTNINDGSIVIGMQANAGGVPNIVSTLYSNFIIMSGNSVSITSASAGATSYSIANASGWALGDGSVEYAKQLLFYSQKTAGAQSPTSASLSGTTLTLTFASSLNPTTTASYLWYGSKSQNAGAVLIGAGISANSQSSYSQGNRVVNNGSYSLTIGQNMLNSGGASIVAGLRANNSGTASAVFGDRNVNVAKYALIAGQGHNTTQYGSDTVAAVGKYSSVSTDTAFVVGNGTADNARSNAFTVHSDGRATVGAAPVNNMDVATKKYVDDNAGGGGDSVWVESNDVAYYPDTTSPTMSIDSTNDITTINGDVVINSTDATFANAQSLKFAAASDKDCQFALTSNGTNMDVGWDWSTGDGAGLGLRSKRFSSNPGGFALYAKSTTSDEKRLEGKVNGVLTWNSRRVVTSTNGSAVGGATQPVYIDSNGYPQLVTQMDTSKLMNPPIETSGIGDPTYRPLINNRRANHLAFLPASQIIIEQTTDGGTTWVDAGISDGAKINLFSETRASTVYLPLVNGQVSALGGLRITFTPMNYAVPSGVAETDKYSYWRRPDTYDTTASYNVGDRVYVSTNNFAIYTCKTAIAAPAGTFNSTYWTASSNIQERYFSLQNMYFWLSVANTGIGIGVKYQVAKGNAPDTWVDIFDSDSYNTAMGGWSGGNCIKFANTVIGGSLAQTGNSWNCRLTFFPRTTSGGSDIASGLTGKPFIQEIRGFGDSWWATINADSAYASIDHLYKWDYLKNATFPAKITVGSAPTANMDVATKQYVDNAVSGGGGGGGSNEYILEAPGALVAGGSVVTGSYDDFQAAVTAMQAGKKVYVKIGAEQIEGTIGGGTDNYLYELLSGYHTNNILTFCWKDYINGAWQDILVQAAVLSNTVYWSIRVDSLTAASGVSF